MKWRLTKTQVNMLIDGKMLKCGRVRLSADKDLRAQLQIIADHDAYALFDIIVESTDAGYGIDIIEKESCKAVS